MFDKQLLHIFPGAQTCLHQRSAHRANREPSRMGPTTNPLEQEDSASIPGYQHRHLFVSVKRTAAEAKRMAVNTSQRLS